MGTTQPSEAAEAVRLLSGFSRVTNALTNIGRAPPLFLPTISPDANLYELIKGFIEELANADRAAELRLKFGGDKYYQLLTFRISIDARTAFITIPNGTKESTFEIYAQSKSHYLEQKPRRTTEVQLDFYILEAAGRLLADTLARQLILIPNPAPGSAGKGNADPEATKAAGPGSHNGLLSGQPATTPQTAPLNKAQSILRKESKQSAFGAEWHGSQVRHVPADPATVRTRHHGTNWPAASPA